jgi:hypothetical protein
MGVNIDLENLKYPVGKFRRPDVIATAQLRTWIEDIELLPARARDLATDLTLEELNYHYRPEGWNIKQVVHHLADSHMNSFIRFKLTLTEEVPTIKPYLQDKWAELPDATDSNISESLIILEGVHARWSKLLRSLTEEDLQREFLHPESKGKITLGINVALYAWHCNHHLEHIKQALKYRGVFST